MKLVKTLSFIIISIIHFFTLPLVFASDTIQLTVDGELFNIKE